MIVFHQAGGNRPSSKNRRVCPLYCPQLSALESGIWRALFDSILNLSSRAAMSSERTTSTKHEHSTLHVIFLTRSGIISERKLIFVDGHQ